MRALAKPGPSAPSIYVCCLKKNSMSDAFWSSPLPERRPPSCANGFARIHDLAHAIAHSENSEDPLARRWLADGAPQCQQAQLRLERALYHFDQAAIYTIHGFCQRALLDAP